MSQTDSERVRNSAIRNSQSPIRNSANRNPQSATGASSPLLRHDENNVPQVQIKIPIQKPHLPQAGIQSGPFGSQAKNDVTHRVRRAINSFRADFLHDESVTSQQSLQRITRKIVKVSRGMNLAPFASPDSGDKTIQVTGRESQQATWSQ